MVVVDEELVGVEPTRVQPAVLQRGFVVEEIDVLENLRAVAPTAGIAVEKGDPLVWEILKATIVQFE
jgi:hypothetical protein